jgi:hypothetical protein
MNHLRLQKKGQLSDLEAKRKTLAIRGDNLQVVILQKVDTIGDPAGIDSLGLKTAADELHDVVVEIGVIDTQINKLRDELYS